MKTIEIPNELTHAAVLLLHAALHKINENLDRRDFWLEPPTPVNSLKTYTHIDMNRLSTGGY